MGSDLTSCCPTQGFPVPFVPLGDDDVSGHMRCSACADAAPHSVTGLGSLFPPGSVATSSYFKLIDAGLSPTPREKGPLLARLTVLAVWPAATEGLHSMGFRLGPNKSSLA